MSRHVVRQGETLSRIAKRYSLAGWESIYNHPENAQFRQRRRNPNLLFPGDELFIPEPRPREENLPTDQRHVFRFKRPKQMLRIAVEDMNGQRISNADYKIWVDGALLTGRTDAKGLLEVEIPIDAQEGNLSVGDYAWPLEIGHLNPLEESPDGGVSGAQGRLLNLGYLTGAVDGVLGPMTKAAIRAFQANNALSVTGELDDATRTTLLKIHGC